jgi:TctA family transporter
MGLFGISEVLLMAEGNEDGGEVLNYRQSLRDLLPNRTESIESIGPVMRGSVLGFFLGLLPGGGAMMASFASYMLERKISRHPERFGKGAVAGVAGPEAANNAGAQASFVPLLCLGIPANAVIGVIMGALLMAGVTPGPMLIVDHPELFWGVIASMFVGNLMLVVLNVPLVGLFVSLLRVPPAIMSALIVVFCVIGAFSLNNSMFDVGAMIGFRHPRIRLAQGEIRCCAAAARLRARQHVRTEFTAGPDYRVRQPARLPDEPDQRGLSRPRRPRDARTARPRALAPPQIVRAAVGSAWDYRG